MRNEADELGGTRYQMPNQVPSKYNGMTAMKPPKKMKMGKSMKQSMSKKMKVC